MTHYDWIFFSFFKLLRTAGHKTCENKKFTKSLLCGELYNADGPAMALLTRQLLAALPVPWASGYKCCLSGICYFPILTCHINYFMLNKPHQSCRWVSLSHTLWWYPHATLFSSTESLALFHVCDHTRSSFYASKAKTINHFND